MRWIGTFAELARVLRPTKAWLNYKLYITSMTAMHAEQCAHKYGIFSWRFCEFYVWRFGNETGTFEHGFCDKQTRECKAYCEDYCDHFWRPGAAMPKYSCWIEDDSNSTCPLVPISEDVTRYLDGFVEGKDCRAAYI